MNSIYQTKIGLQRWSYAPFRLNRNWKGTPYTKVFGAYVWCLKNRDAAAADFLKEHLKCLSKDEIS